MWIGHCIPSLADRSDIDATAEVFNNVDHPEFVFCAIVTQNVINGQMSTKMGCNEVCLQSATYNVILRSK